MVKGFNTDGWIRAVRPEITPPSLKDNTADVDRIIKALERELEGESVLMDFSLVQEIPSFLGRHGYEMWAVLYKDHRAWRVMDILPPEREGALYGLAMKSVRIFLPESISQMRRGDWKDVGLSF